MSKECVVLTPIFVGGEPKKVNDVVPLADQDAAYLEGLGRVRVVVEEEPAPVEKPEKPKGKAK